jgi:Tol biopolymer transport system component
LASTSPSISADGRFVAFESTASNLVSGDTNRDNDVFVRDRVAGRTTRVSVTTSGSQGNRSSGREGLAITADARFVVFSSNATNLVAGDTNLTTDVFVRDRLASRTTRVSIATSGAQANSYSYLPSISADGRYVAFISAASNLMAGFNGTIQVFVRDGITGATTRTSIAASGAQANAHSGQKGTAISADGRFVAFQSYATNLVAGDTNRVSDVFVRER